ncbi:MAG: MarR family transcriptional regulator [Thermomicrobiales bacterium]
MDNERAQFIEEFGLVFEGLGSGRMLGRVLALLMISDPPTLSAEEIAVALKASRGSVSQGTRALIQMGMIRRISVPGERRDYFQIRPYAWTEAIRREGATIDRMLAVFQHGLCLTEGHSPEARLALEESVAFMQFWKRRMGALFQEWDEERERIFGERSNRHP